MNMVSKHVRLALHTKSKIAKVEWYLFSLFSKKWLKHLSTINYEGDTNTSGNVKCLYFLKVYLIVEKNHWHVQ